MNIPRPGSGGFLSRAFGDDNGCGCRVRAQHIVLEITSRGVAAADRKRANNANRRRHNILTIEIAHLSSSRYYIIVMPKPRCRAVREELGDPAGTISDAAAAGVYFKT